MADMDTDAPPADDGNKLQVRFVAKLPDGDELDIPSNAFAVPDRLTRKGLAEVVNGMLDLDDPQPFDFLVNGEFLRCSLASFVKSRHLSTELTIKIEVVRVTSGSKPAQLRVPQLGSATFSED